MAFRASAPHKRSRWVVLMAVLAIATTVLATTALALTTDNPPTFQYVNDTLGADDQPGQKDLNSQSSVDDGANMWVSWKWDDTSWPGGNTGDACALFTTNANNNIDFAVCVTVGGKPVASQLENSPRIYTCGDGKEDRCTSQIALVSAPYDTACSVAIAAVDPYHTVPGGGGPANDTVATCHIDLAEVGATSATLVNTCSYPSEQPNSDPSDCVLIVGSSMTTLSSGTASWSATLNDSATVTPTTATGTVTFRLYSDATCTTLRWTSSAIALSSGTAVTGTDVGTNNIGTGRVINSTDFPTGGTFYWIATYTPAAGSTVTGTASACGEATVVTPASVAGNAG